LHFHTYKILLKMTVGSREDLFAQAKHIDDTERLIGRVLAGE